MNEKYKELQELSPIEEPEKYLDLLDELELEDLLEKQKRRREIVLDKVKNYE